MQSFKEYFFSRKLNAAQKGVIVRLHQSVEQMLYRGLVQQDSNGRISIPNNYLSGLRIGNESFLINQGIYIPYSNTELHFPGVNGGQEYIVIDGRKLHSLANEHGSENKEMEHKAALSRVWGLATGPGATGGIELTPSARGY
jgi:hypothetical protein